MGEKKKYSKGKRLLTNIVLVCCVVVFAFSTWKLVGYLNEYKKGEQIYENMAQYVTVPEADKKAPEKKHPPVVQWDELSGINLDLVGWISIEDTVIQYPVVQGEDNERYLQYTFDGKKNSCGCIFMDVENEPNFTSDNTILHGHNMKTGAMFGTLQYYEDEKYWEDHPYIWIITKDRTLKYEIFATYQTTVKDSVYTLEFGSEENFQTYLDQCKNESIYDTGVDVTPEDRLLTLSTCTSDTEEGRRVVQAKLIYDEEIKNEE